MWATAATRGLARPIVRHPLKGQRVTARRHDRGPICCGIDAVAVAEDVGRRPGLDGSRNVCSGTSLGDQPDTYPMLSPDILCDGDFRCAQRSRNVDCGGCNIIHGFAMSFSEFVVELSHIWLIAMPTFLLLSLICIFVPSGFANIYLLSFIGLVAAGLGAPLGFWLDGEDRELVSPPGVLPIIWQVILGFGGLILFVCLFRMRNYGIKFMLAQIGVVAGPLIAATIISFAWHHDFRESYKISALALAKGRPFCILPTPIGNSGNIEISVHKLFRQAGYPNIDGIYLFYSTMIVGDEAYNWSFRQGSFVPLSNRVRQDWSRVIACAPDRTSFEQ